MNYYEVLGVTPRSEPEVIEAVYRALMKKYHPDRSQGDVREAALKAMQLNEAYATLRDPRKREIYDRQVIRFGDFSGDDRRRQPRDTILIRGPAVSPWPRRALIISGVIGLAGLGAALLYFEGGEPLAAQALAEVSEVARLNEPDVQAPPLRTDGKHRVVCIENSSDQALNYALWWGNRRQSAQIKPGFHVVHSSAYDVEPTVELAPMPGMRSRPARISVESAIVWQDGNDCSPRYTFAYRGADRTGPIALFKNSPDA